MATYTNLVTPLLMGVFLAIVVLVVVRLRDWRRYTPGGPDGLTLTTIEQSMSRASKSMTVWILTFLVLTLGFGGGTLLILMKGIPEAIQSMLFLAVGVLFLALLGGYVLYGTYRAARVRGRPRSTATAAGLWVFGHLLLVAIVAKLVFSG